MKRFEIITETDARVLERGESVMLARGGHITPLAQDTLNERRVTVVLEGRVSAADASLVPRADIRAVANILLTHHHWDHVSDLPHAGTLKFLAEENATVAHVTAIKAEAATEVVAATATEPEVAKKGKPEAAAADAKKK